MNAKEVETRASGDTITDTFPQARLATERGWTLWPTPVISSCSQRVQLPGIRGGL